jgi:integrase
MQLHIQSLETRKAAASSPGPVWTLATWLQHWLSHYGPTRCSPKTLERYVQLSGYIPHELGNVPLLKLSHTDLETALFAMLKARGKRRAHLSCRTIHNIAGVFSVALNKAFRLDLIPVSPMLRVELPAIERKDVRALTPDEIQRVRETCRGDWTFALAELALSSGARRGELLALTWSDVDWLARSMKVDKSLEQTRAGLRLKRPKSNRSRVFCLPQSALAALEFHRTQQQGHKRLFGSDYKDQGLVFLPTEWRVFQARSGLAGDHQANQESRHQKRQPAFFAPCPRLTFALEGSSALGRFSQAWPLRH